ncbi:helix-turn-helix domain-containing protein [Streptococcus penaeicida]
MDERKLLVRIAEMYYQESKTQSQISKELNIHRTTISRLLKQSRDEGIVEIIINYDKAGN